MNLSAMQDAIFDWIKAASSLGDDAIAWEPTNAPRLTNPSLRLKLIGPFSYGDDEITHVDDDEFRISGPRGFTLSVNAYGESGLQVLSDVITSVRSPIINFGVLEPVGISITRAGTPRDLSALLDTKWERRMQVDIDLLVFEDLTVQQDTIESISGSSDIGGRESDFSTDA